MYVWCSEKPEVTGSPGAGVTGSSEPPDLGDGNLTPTISRMTLNW